MQCHPASQGQGRNLNSDPDEWGLESAFSCPTGHGPLSGGEDPFSGRTLAVGGAQLEGASEGLVRVPKLAAWQRAIARAQLPLVTGQATSSSMRNGQATSVRCI